jgi:hypothetical protein
MQANFIWPCRILNAARTQIKEDYNETYVALSLPHYILVAVDGLCKNS